MACVFCEISAGNLPASMVYEDRDVFALMSLEQPNPYKVLVVPRTHIETIYGLDEKLAASVFQVTVKIARAIRNVSKCDGLNIIQSNGRAGQQDVFHFHLHLLPRFTGDKINLAWNNTLASRELLDQLAYEIRGKL